MLVLGHRGWPEPSHPENTLTAVTAALDGGADGVEVDVRLTADGVAVCCHDDDLLRVGADLRSVRASRHAEVATILLPGGHQVPRLLDVATAVAGRGQLVLDLKPEPRAAALLRACLATLTMARFPLDDVVVSSFDARLLDVLAVRRPQVARAAILDLGDALQPALGRARRRGDAALHLPLRTVLAAPNEVRDCGLAIRAWTVNRLVDARLCALLGVDAVITDRPTELAVALRAPALLGPVGPR